MSILAKLAGNRRRAIIAAAVIIVLAASIRYYHIGWSYSNNGVDEGVMLQRALLLSRDFELYSELPCDQPPLALYVGAVLKGDVVTLRALEATLSLLAIAACMFLARRIGGDIAMLSTGIFLAVDFAFLRESRMFSLDGMASYFLAFSLLLFYYYTNKGDRYALYGAGLLIGVSAASKLLGVLGLLGFLLFMVSEVVRDRSLLKSKGIDTGILVAGAALPMMLFLLMLGPSDMLQGMLFDQTHRELDLFLKLSILAYLGLNMTYILPITYARAMWESGPHVRFIFIVAMTILAFMVIQPLVFFHHLVLLSPPLAVLAGYVTAETIKFEKGIRKRTSLHDMLRDNPNLRRFGTVIILLDIGASLGLAFYGAAMQGEPSEIVYANRLREITVDGEYVLCGDPLIATHADRLTPPEVVNVAYRRYPQLTLDDIKQAIEDPRYNVSVVVVCFRLKDIDGLMEYLRSRDFFLVVPPWVGIGDDTVLDLFDERIDPVYFYVTMGKAEQYDIPVLGLKSAGTV